MINNDITKNFFDQNPEMTVLPELRSLIDDVGREEASKIMWVVYMCEDPRSYFYRELKDDRRRLIEQNFYGSEFPWDKYEGLLSAYPMWSMSKKRRMFKVWSDKLDELSSYLRDLSFDTDSKTILQVFKDGENYWKTFQRIEKDMIEEEDQEQMRGGRDAGGMYKRLKNG